MADEELNVVFNGDADDLIGALERINQEMDALQMRSNEVTKKTGENQEEQADSINLTTLALGRLVGITTRVLVPLTAIGVVFGGISKAFATFRQSGTKAAEDLNIAFSKLDATFDQLRVTFARQTIGPVADDLEAAADTTSSVLRSIGNALTGGLDPPMTPRRERLEQQKAILDEITDLQEERNEIEERFYRTGPSGTSTRRERDIRTNLAQQQLQFNRLRALGIRGGGQLEDPLQTFARIQAAITPPINPSAVREVQEEREREADKAAKETAENTKQTNEELRRMNQKGFGSAMGQSAARYS